MSTAFNRQAYAETKVPFQTTLNIDNCLVR